MVEYSSAGIYLSSKKTTEDRLAAIEAIIDELLLRAADAAGTAGVVSYTLNDGQSVLNGQYRSVTDMRRAIVEFEGLANMYRNRLNGRVARNVDSKNMQSRGV